VHVEGQEPGWYVLGEAVNCAVYILNRTTFESTGGKTPYELWKGSRLLVSHLRTFGCVVHVKVTKPNLKKLDDKSRPMIFVGYEPGSAAYRCYDPNTKCLHISRDVIFDEKVVWNWLVGQAAEMNFEFTIDGQTEIHESIEASPDVVEVIVPSVTRITQKVCQRKVHKKGL
jgi:hypothetical protein